MGFYDDLFDLHADDRVKGWFLMGDPVQFLIILGTYFLAVCIVLPRFMLNRPAYNIKAIIQTYNLFQIVACCYLFYGFCANGWLTTYSFVCQPVDYSENPSALKMLNLMHLTLMLKLVELAETFFFILRHKNNQVSFLHLYHHSTTACYTWISTKFTGGGMGSFALTINCLVHIIMYSYYFLSAFGPKMQSKLAWIKKRITIIQLIQFAFMLLNTGFMLMPSCDYNKYVAASFAPDVVILMAFFAKFYKKSYTNKPDAQKMK